MLIDYALLLGTGIAMYEGLNYLCNFRSNKKWSDLQKGIKIENYRILKIQKLIMVAC